MTEESDWGNYGPTPYLGYDTVLNDTLAPPGQSASGDVETKSPCCT